MRTFSADNVVKTLEAQRGGIGSSRPLMAALAAMGEEAEKNAQAAASTAVNEAEKRFKAILTTAERARAAADADMRATVAEGIAKVGEAVKARDLKGAEALVDKLSLALGEARRTHQQTLEKLEAGLLAAVEELHDQHEAMRKEILAALKTAMPAKAETSERKPWDVKITGRDNSGRAKEIKLIPA